MIDNDIYDDDWDDWDNFENPFFDEDEEFDDTPRPSDLLMEECEQMFAKGGLDLMIASYKVYDCYQQMMSDAVLAIADCSEADCLQCEMKYEMNRRPAGTLALLHLSQILSYCRWLQDWNKANDDIDGVIAWINRCVKASAKNQAGTVLDPSFVSTNNLS